MLFGGIEAGGTKFVCAVGDEKKNAIKRTQIPTTIPEETLARVIRFFEGFELDAIGIGSFGPADVHPKSPTYGMLTTTPKTAWRNVPLMQRIHDRFRVPVGFQTDVNAAALGEAAFGAAQGLDSCLYITVGTGIGAGAVIHEKLLHGLSHPEMGHILVRRHPNDEYPGRCPYHQDCLEGLASGPAIEDRWGEKGVLLKEREEVWKLEGYYIAQALMQYILILSPQKVILGGGVMKQELIWVHIRQYLKELLNDYIDFPQLSSRMDDYIVPPQLGDDAGVKGALVLADQARQEAKGRGD
ncbi:ROK family protein [Paludifilum halophilum]|uniref:fructokinase n=1 Tax=Paludifilum halophilum TaxID=1642702 RepID=A0A235B9P5_9BACL|nr:ROK family protein [Paludifilum halophilum]OYD09030.1 fructokinase [Paludifilum halophilum]